MHALVWLKNIELIDLPKVVSATIPDENEPLEHIVLASQQSYTGSGWEVRREPSEWNREEQKLQLQHSKEDHWKGIRAYMPDIIGGMKSHMDVQASDGRGMLLRYVAGYASKFSDSFAQEWLNDYASDYAISRRVLTEYHPLEPEMWMQLAGKLHAQCITTGTMKRFVVPKPWVSQTPARITQYIDSTWRVPEMNLLEFLRKSNCKGGIHKAFKERYKKLQEAKADEVRDKTLEDWVNTANCQGEVLVAAICVGKLESRIYSKLGFDARLFSVWVFGLVLV